MNTVRLYAARHALASLVAAVSLAALPARAAASNRPPNIIFIMADDHAAHALSCYGSRINRTPNLDRLAAAGIRFTNCFVTNSICGPSRACILTGKYTHLNGFYRNGNTFDGGQQTFPKLLQQAGYHTAMIGKWHLRSDPTGFDYWNVLPGQGAYYDPVLIEMGSRKVHPGYVTDVITDLALAYLEQRPADRPFCLMLHHKAPHRNWEPGPLYRNLYDDETIPEPATIDDDYRDRASPAHTQAMTVKEHLTPRDLKIDPPDGLTADELAAWKYQRYIKDYLRCIASIDDNVGRVLDYLDRTGLASNTMVIYTSDQGFFLGDHGWFDKRFMYGESLRSPLLVRYPPKVKPGTTNDRIVLNIDFAETFLELAGVDVPADMQGASLVPLLAGESPADWRTSMYYHYYEFPGAHSVRRHRGVRTDRYKLIHYYRIDEWELFDLQSDPHEMRSVYGDARYASVVTELKGELARLRTELGDDADDDPAEAEPPRRR